MTRSIAILTLALTAALSADEASAWPLYVNTNVASTFAQQNELDAGGGSNLYQQNELEFNPGECITALRDGDDLNELIAIIAFDSSPETAYLTLLDMGFSLAEADDMVLGVLVNNEAFSVWDVPMD